MYGKVLNLMRVVEWIVASRAAAKSGEEEKF